MILRLLYLLIAFLDVLYGSYVLIAYKRNKSLQKHHYDIQYFPIHTRKQIFPLPDKDFIQVY